MDVKLTPTSYAVMGLVSLAEPCTPYDLKRAIEMSVSNFWPVPHTTFYAEPERLARAGLLDEEREQHGRRRKLYSLTAAGREALAAWVAEPDVGPPQVRDEAVLKVFLGAEPGPLVAQRLAFHRAKLAELDGYLEDVHGNPDWPPGVERSLRAGVAYNRGVIAMLEELVASRA
jgi:DNA-binding PadR family transcriptional regulator